MQPTGKKVTPKPEENVNVFSKWLVSGGIWGWLGIYLMGFNKSGDWEGVSSRHVNEGTTAAPADTPTTTQNTHRDSCQLVWVVVRVLRCLWDTADIPTSPIPTSTRVPGSGTKTIPLAIGSNPVGNNVRLEREPVE